MKSLTCFFAIIALVATANAQVLPVNAATQKAAFTFRFSVGKNMTDEQAFELAEKWFSQQTTACSRCNSNARMLAVENSSRNKAEVEKVFGNNRPLQAIDPMGNRLSARIITQYAADNNSALRLMILQSSMVITIHEGVVTCEISDMRYNHFNPRSYNYQRIQSWGGGASLESVDTIEYLMNNAQGNGEVAAFFQYIKTDMQQLAGTFSQFMNGQQVVSMN